MFEAEIRVATRDGMMTTFLSHPNGVGPFPVAVLFMDGVGYREQIKHNARRFASSGYYVVAPDLFYRSGEKISFDFTRMHDPTYRDELMGVVSRITPERAVADTEAIFYSIADDPAAAESGAKVCVGYCMGARLALHVAATRQAEFVAIAGIHPSALVTDRRDSPHLEVGDIRGEVYFAFAENDQSATAENVAMFQDELEQRGVRGTVERLPGTSHGFAMADLPVYDQPATEKHFDRTLELWRRNLSPVGQGMTS
jgi:carboxymethylenebutenolidase